MDSKPENVPDLTRTSFTALQKGLVDRSLSSDFTSPPGHRPTSPGSGTVSEELLPATEEAFRKLKAAAAGERLQDVYMNLSMSDIESVLRLSARKSHPTSKRIRPRSCVS